MRVTFQSMCAARMRFIYLPPVTTISTVRYLQRETVYRENFFKNSSRHLQKTLLLDPQAEKNQFYYVPISSGCSANREPFWISPAFCCSIAPSTWILTCCIWFIGKVFFCLKMSYNHAHFFCKIYNVSLRVKESLQIMFNAAFNLPPSHEMSSRERGSSL